ncbi:MAG: LysE family transporter [Verrucomicrobiota bacterium]
MSGPLELLAFAGVMALGQFSPGPDMLVLTRTALKSGARAGVEMAAGIACGLAVHSAVALGGLALAFQQTPILAETLRWGAAAYLLWISWSILRELFVVWYSGAIYQVDVVPPRQRPFLRGLTCNLLNPKAAIFLAAVSAPFLSGNHPRGWPLALGGIVVIQGFLLWSLWACLLQWKPLAARYRKMERGIDLMFAAVLVVLAVGLIFG